MKEVWVEFIGSGYEVVKMIKVLADSFKDAFDKADIWYKETKQDFHYCELEVKDGKYIQF